MRWLSNLLGQVTNLVRFFISTPGSEADHDGEKDKAVVAEARQVVDGGGDLAGLRELVSKLIADLEADAQP